MVDTQTALTQVKGIKAVESIYEQSFGKATTESEKEQHIEKMIGSLL